MSLTYSFYAVTPMTPAECRQLLKNELGMVVSTRAPLTAVDDVGLTVFVSLPLEGRVLRETERKFIGFQSSLVATCNPVLGGPHFDMAHETMGQVFDLLLSRTTGPAAITVEADRILMRRKHDELVVRTDAVQYMQPSALAQISCPYVFGELRP